MLCKVLFWLSSVAILAKCDKNDEAPQLRIIGGDQSKLNYKFMISLQMRVRETNIPTNHTKYQHICGGSIVRNNCIVTAAHCVENSTPDALSVVVGTNNLGDESGDRYHVHNFTIHYKYKPLVESDIAIVFLNESLKFSDRVGPIALSKQFIGNKVRLRLLGWGHTNPIKYGTRPPLKLRELLTTSISNEECNKNGIVTASDTDLCTYERMLKGACNGDSGGPLILDRDGVPTLEGIVSRGCLICSMYGIPDVFSRISVFVDWINDQCGNDTLAAEEN